MCSNRLDLKKSNNDYNIKKLLEIISIQLWEKKQFILFLDIDGTLSEFHSDPSQSFISHTTLKILEKLKNLNVQVIAITGRSVKIASQLFSPLDLPIAGTHGLEIKIDQKNLSKEIESINYPLIRESLKQACIPYPKLLIENKDYSVALHYRQCPELEQTAYKIIKDVQLLHPELKINTGKYVFELLPHGADKGQAIHKILQHFNLPTAFSIFIGDDRTDESGFKVINEVSGMSIKVGAEETRASYRLKNVNAVEKFLDLFSKLLEKNSLSTSQILNGENKCLN
ncbi:trehalose-phosphatase [Acinetobacter albensis]|uniref:Trehalose 6-phosphate phosphatase n=1 Tax=Acinetobacter albensis TaxID=1673609 RepID=A0ABW9JVP3_9GAMM